MTMSEEELQDMITSMEADIYELEAQLATYRDCANYWWVAYKRDVEGFVPMPTSSSKEDDEAIRAMDRQRAWLKEKAEALDWLEQYGGIELWVTDDDIWHAQDFAADHNDPRGHGKTPLEAMQDFKRQVEGE